MSKIEDPLPAGGGRPMRGAEMWRTAPIWMARYQLSSWLMAAALCLCPGPRYADELRRRVYSLRDQVIADVIAHRAKGKET